MNEQIKELALKSGIAYLSEHTAYLTGNDGLTVLPSVDSLEKFAELIVRECMALCKSMDETDTQYRYDYRRGVMDCVDTIKEHFGVEE